ncbi:DNA cytosine methyltransferase [Sphingobium yanoikuyae]|uniref:DNA cytosine methyltransferase n=1 Tax=Sphingobium yanoikuyae TaxID=13690 RepID=UPI00345E8D7D
MRYIDVCSGISAPTVAWKPLGWDALCYAEIEAAPRAVLAHHYPDVPLVGDFTQIEGTEYGPVDLLVGGTPCQSFSIAGLRGGLADERGNLALEYLRLAHRSRARWLVWENVPGVLSIDGGRAFGAILGGMAELGYGFAYRVLDAQHFGVPQRRRRVFAVGYLGDWRRAAAVLFERHSLSGHPAPRREKGQGVAGTLKACAGKSGTPNGAEEADRLIIAPTLNAAFGSKLGLDNQHIDSGAGMFVTHSLRGEGFDASEDGTGRGTPLVPVAFSAKDYGADAMENCSPTLRAGGFRESHANAGVMPAVAFPINPNALRGDSCAKTPSKDAAGAARLRDPGLGVGQDGDPADTLQAAGPGAVCTASAVRRLTPRECERLQGFPDDFTLIPYRGRMMADGPRYKMLGNSMAVPVMRWIGERIAMVDALYAEGLAA